MALFARACAVALGMSLGLSLGAVAGVAAADTTTGTVDPAGDRPGFTVDVGDGVFAALDTRLIGLRLGADTVLGTYCVEIDTEIDEREPMVERPWAGSPFTENHAKVNWVLHNGFPVRSPAALTTALTGAGAALTDAIDEREAVTATQAAIWHFSDGVDLDRDNPLPGSPAGNANDVLALYDHLTGRANVGLAEEPTASLAVDPRTVTGDAGTRLGPLTVSTTAATVAVTATGARVTDADGRPVTEARDGTDLFLDIPADAPAGRATVTLAATAVVETGRLFVGEDYDRAPTQSLIVAQASESDLTASAQANWDDVSPAAQGRSDSGLAETGASVLAPVLLGSVLVGAGIVSVLFVRRRRSAL